MTDHVAPALARLRREMGDQVLDDPVSLGLYATDASMYQITPLAIVQPRDRDAALAAIRLCAAERLPLLARGGGTSLTGQSIGAGVILDVSRHLDRMLELNLEEAWVRVEPGIVCSELNALLNSHGVHFAPDPATENRANVGGMIANNSAGMRSVRYGMTIDHVLEIDLALASGEVLHLGPLDQSELAALSGWRGEILNGVHALVARNRDEILRRYPKVIRRSGGYPLDALVVEDPWNPAKLICGSEGTLGVILEAKLRLTPLPRHSAVCLAHFASLDASLRAAMPLVAEGPSAVELIDGVVLRQARSHPLTRDICSQIQGDPAAILVIEVQGEDAGAVAAHIRRMAATLDGQAYAAPVMTEGVAIQAVWQLRSSALGLMTTIEGRKKPVPYIEDAAVPPAVLADYVEEVLQVCRRHGQPVSMFGHASVGLIHIRPLHDLRDATEIERMKQIQEEVFPLVLKYGGSWSGEHGDGIVRGGFNRRYFGDVLYTVFQEIKRLFDPEARMNPGKVIDALAVDSHLRYGPTYHPQPPASLFHYRAQGGMQAAVEQCTGVGVCRKTQGGVMCPSYVATRDERHSTRGRANALRLAIAGQLGVDALASDEIKAVLDLCLACKGCKGECPNGVDMARLKAEVTHLYQRRHGVSRRARLFANMAVLAGLASGPQSLLANAVLRNGVVRLFLQKWFDIDRNRPIPPYAKRRLSDWFAGQQGIWQSLDADTVASKRVVLFNDTYMEHYLPGIGRAAVEVLTAAGYQVQLSQSSDSQRSAISQGLLDQAKRKGTVLFRELDALTADGASILVCEPSCASALADDLPDLLDDPDLVSRVAGRVIMLDRFLEQELAAGRCELNLHSPVEGEPRLFLVHSHCHQKTLDGGRWTHKLLGRIPGAIVEDSEAGCCGMAGAFGYEVEHAELSRRIAGAKLLPRLDRGGSNIQVVANGFSCRHQIADLSRHKPRHFVEVIRGLL